MYCKSDPTGDKPAITLTPVNHTRMKQLEEALALIFARSKNEKFFKPTENPTETLSTQATQLKVWQIIISRLWSACSLCTT